MGNLLTQRIKGLELPAQRHKRMARTADTAADDVHPHID